MHFSVLSMHLLITMRNSLISVQRLLHISIDYVRQYHAGVDLRRDISYRSFLPIHFSTTSIDECQPSILDQSVIKGGKS
ncbi:hypothetical protein ACH3XW_14910 [Acanthocheilonema viteae]